MSDKLPRAAPLGAIHGPPGRIMIGALAGEAVAFLSLVIWAALGRHCPIVTQRWWLAGACALSTTSGLAAAALTRPSVWYLRSLLARSGSGETYATIALTDYVNEAADDALALMCQTLALQLELSARTVGPYMSSRRWLRLCDCVGPEFATQLEPWHAPTARRFQLAVLGAVEACNRQDCTLRVRAALKRWGAVAEGADVVERGAQVCEALDRAAHEADCLGKLVRAACAPQPHGEELVRPSLEAEPCAYPTASDLRSLTPETRRSERSL